MTNDPTAGREVRAKLVQGGGEYHFERQRGRGGERAQVGAQRTKVLPAASGLARVCLELEQFRGPSVEQIKQKHGLKDW